MAHWQTCPKCNGQGIVSKPPWVAGDVNTWSATSASFICDVCHGAKILFVPDEDPRQTLLNILEMHSHMLQMHSHMLRYYL